MTVRTQLSGLVCPVARALDVLGDPWTLLILREVFVGNRRFDGLKDELAIADTVLSKRLRVLVDAGLLDRVRYGGLRSASCRVRPHGGRRGHAAGAARAGAVGASAHEVANGGMGSAGGVCGVWSGDRERGLVPELCSPTRSRANWLASGARPREFDSAGSVVTCDHHANQ